VQHHPAQDALHRVRAVLEGGHDAEVAARRVTDQHVRMLTVVSPSGLQRFFESGVRVGEEELLAHPARLVALAAKFGSEILGEYPNL
jgi:hypothetical protein